MSVILDALRRARGRRLVATTHPTPAVPAGLRLRRSARRGVKRGKARWPVLAGFVLLAGVVWTSVQVGLPLMRRQAATRPASVVSRLQQAQPAPPPQAEPRSIVPGPAPGQDADAGGASPPAIPDDTRTARADRIGAPRPAVPRARPPIRRDEPQAPPSPVPPPAAVLPVNAGTTPAVNHFELAVRHHNLGNFELALTHYTAAIQEDEFNVEARNNLGLLYHERGLLNEAMEQFRRALAISPQYVRARSNLAVVLMDSGRLAEARAELRAALFSSPRNADLLVNMALVEKADQHAEQARETLIRALGYEPLHAAAHYNLALLYDEAGETGRAYSHYNDFLRNAGPEYGTRLADVQRRVDAIAPTLDR